LEVTDLHAGYGRRTVLFGVSMTVAKGSITVILGANGAGKSTTLKAVAGAVRVSTGSVRYGGVDTTNQPVPANVLLGIAMVPAAGGAFCDVAVRESLPPGAYRARDQSVVRQRIDQVCTLFPNLGHRLRQQAGTLSGGERQMLAIGRALMSWPSCLLL